jgi:hypothetical protein
LNKYLPKEELSKYIYIREEYKMNRGFQNWWERINGLIRRVLIFLFSALIVTQTLLMNQTIKTFISRTDKLEGRSIAESQLFIKRGEVEISIENYPSLKPLVFYVNGEGVSTPSGKKIKLRVKDSDIIEVSGSLNDTVILKVTAVSENIMVPQPGKFIYVNDNLVMIDRVRIR